MSSGQKDKSPVKQKKLTAIKQVPGTFEGWKTMVTELGLYDKKYQKEKFCFKEVNLINYFLEAFELMAQLKGAFSSDSFIITLIEMNRSKNKGSSEQLKVFLTAFLTSFQNLVYSSGELSYFTRMVDPQSLASKPPTIFSFYLKMRKFVFFNFVNERDPQIKPLKFDQWVSVVAKFLDNKAIQTIGTQIKEKAAQQQLNDKMMDNSVDPLELIILCFEEKEKRLAKQKKPVSEAKPKQSDAQKQQQQKQPLQSQESVEESEDYGGDTSMPYSKAHQIAYNITMGRRILNIYINQIGPPDSIKQYQSKKQPEQDETEQVRDYSQVKRTYDRYEEQHNMIQQLNISVNVLLDRVIFQQKQRVTEERAKQSQVFNEVLQVHEQLAANYKYLANFTQEFEQLVQNLTTKIRNGSSVGESELKQLEKHCEFNDYLPEDPELTLQNSGIYEIIKKQ